MPKIHGDSRSLEKHAERAKARKEIGKIIRAFDSLLFRGILPSKVGERRKEIQAQILRNGTKMTLKTLDQHKKYWHPQYREPLQTFRSYGGIKGHFYGEEGANKGIIKLSDRGIFPAELGPYFSEKTRKKLGVEDQVFVCWIKSLEEPPYYNFVLERPYWTEASVIRQAFHFRIQGLIVKRNKSIIWVRIQENKPNPEVVFLVQIHEFTEKIKKGQQFWIMDCFFEDGKLVYERGVRVD